MSMNLPTEDHEQRQLPPAQPSVYDAYGVSNQPYNGYASVPPPPPPSLPPASEQQAGHTPVPPPPSLPSAPEQQAGHNNGYASVPPLPPLSALPPLPAPPSLPPASGQQAVHTLRIVLLLLAIICLGSLGAVPLAPDILPASFISPATTSKQAVVKPSPTPTPPGGECTATPQQMKYLSSGKTKVDSTPPPMWITTGHSKQDLANAQACAASFAIAYETIDANDFRTLETSTSLMSSGAQLRFYGRISSVNADTRMDPLWRAIIQKQNLKQTAQVQQPRLLDIRSLNNRFFAWMLVPYSLSLQRNDQTLSRDAQLTVLLVNVTSQNSNTGTGWQVSGWQDGDALFAVPSPV